MQKIILENNTSFEPKHIFECGQCFRWNKESDDSYTGIFSENVLNVKKISNQIIIEGICNRDIKEVVNDYFNLDLNYDEMKFNLSKVDKYMKESICFGSGIRILNQDLWETIISFIISANNNIPRIKGIIEKLSLNFGKEIVFRNKTYYTFPTPKELEGVTVEKYRELGLGFRDKRIFDTVQDVISGKIDLNALKTEADMNILKEQLLTIHGVGPKVCDCIMLFAINDYEAFPIDVWVERVMNQLYIKSSDKKKASKNKILELSNEKFGKQRGIAQQYLFYWIREKQEGVI